MSTKLNTLKKLFILIAGCYFSTILYAQDSKWSVQAGAGISSQDINWSIAGNEQGTNPNILSELKWDKLRAVAYNLQVDYKISQKFGLTFIGAYHDITKGSGNDSDYGQDNRGGRFGNQDFSSNKGNIYNLQLKVNYKLPDLGPVTPKLAAGFEQLGQKLYMTDLPNENNGLRSTYQTQWNGGTIGLILHFPVQSFYIDGYYDFGIYAYNAKANWNLRETLQHPVSFRQQATGFKHFGKIQVGYKLCERLDIGLSLSKYYSFTNEGKDKLYLQSGEIKRSQFNGVEFSQLAGLLNIKYEW